MARAAPRFPAPTIAIRGLAPIPGRIAGKNGVGPRTSGVSQFFSCEKCAAADRGAPDAQRLLYIVCMPKSSPHKADGRKRSKSRIVSSRTVYRGPVFSVSTDDVQEPNGVRARRDVIHH